MTSMERARADLYRRFHENENLNAHDIASTRSLFIIARTSEGVSIEHSPYSFEQGHGVHLICAPVSRPVAQYCFDLGKIVERKLPKGSIYVNTLESLHITIFHTARPNDHRPTGESVCGTEIQQWKDITSDIASFDLELRQVSVAKSGAVIALYSGHGGKTVDLIRNRAQKAFPTAPLDQTHTIIHTTIARILEEIPNLNEIRDIIAQYSNHLQKQPKICRIDRLLYIEETHELSSQGKQTTIDLLN